MAARVLIAGAGPVGLALGLALARRGSKVSVLEKRPGLSAAAGTALWYPPALAILGRLGVLGPLLPQGARIAARAWLRPDGHVRATLPMALLDGATPFPFCWHVDQARVTSALATVLRGMPGCEIVFGAEVVGVAQHAGGVVVALADGQQMHGGWLVGCDGARSRIRDAAGIAADMGGVQHVLHARTMADLKALNPALHDWNDIRTAAGLCTLLRLPGRGWQAAIALKREAAAGGALPDSATMLRHFLPWASGTFPIADDAIRCLPRLSARHYRAGRVLLAGSAAHAECDGSGEALNRGLHEAWTLAAALAAPAPDAAASAWAAVRRDVRAALAARAKAGDGVPEAVIAGGRETRLDWLRGALLFESAGAGAPADSVAG